MGEEDRGPDGRLPKTLIFANTRNQVEQVGNALYSADIDFAELHGDIEQVQRDRALKAFKNDRADVLVSTDVAARGLDIPGIRHVVNFQLPKESTKYVHRIGRTGRIGNRGIATSLVGDEEPSLEGIVETLQEAKDLDSGDTGPIPGWLLRRV